MAALQPDCSRTTAGRRLHDGATVDKGEAAFKMKMNGVVVEGVQHGLIDMAC